MENRIEKVLGKLPSMPSIQTLEEQLAVITYVPCENLYTVPILLTEMHRILISRISGRPDIQIIRKTEYSSTILSNGLFKFSIILNTFFF